MASISAPTPSPHKLHFSNPKPYPSSVGKRPFYPSSSPSSQTRFRFPDSSLCRCQNPSSSSSSESIQWRWDSALQGLIQNAIERFDSYVNFKPQGDSQNASFESGNRDEPDWDWDRWRQHFLEVEEQERLLSLLKVSPFYIFLFACICLNIEYRNDDGFAYLCEFWVYEQSQLGRAVYIEDFEDAARLKVAIAAAATNDVVGRVIFHLNVRVCLFLLFLTALFNRISISLWLAL